MTAVGTVKMSAQEQPTIGLWPDTPENFSLLELIFVKVFDKLNQTYEAVEIDKREDAAAIQEVLEEITGTKTVPRVFLDGTCIGGGTDVKALYENGKLEQMLQKA